MEKPHSIIQFLTSVAAVFTVLTLHTFLGATSVFAQFDPEGQACTALSNITDGGCAEGQGEVTSTIQGAIEILLFIAGAGAVVGVIIGGLRFIFAHGDAKQIAAGRTTIIYSIIGMVVALLAFVLIGEIESRF